MIDKEWLDKLRNEIYNWTSDDQWECCKMIFDLIGGEHHLNGKIKEHGTGIVYVTGSSFATYDFSTLTTLVLLAHKRTIRVEINACNFSHIKICLWKRTKIAGRYWEKHPTIEEAIKEFNKIYKF